MNRSHYKTILTDTMKHALAKRVFLVQTDTTVGFLSQDHARLAKIKERPVEKPFVEVTSSLKNLKAMTRVPNMHKNRVRRASKSTFVHINAKAIRVVKDEEHAAFIAPFGWFYSTSANEKSLSYTQEFAFANSDIIVETKAGLFEGEASTISKLYRRKIQRLR